MKKFLKFDFEADDDLKIYVGESAQENWDLIDQSNQNDIWFHLDKHPSAHVVISIPKKVKKITKNTINYAATLCKDNSKLKYLKKVSVIYTEIKNVKKADKPGSVTTKNTTKILV